MPYMLLVLEPPGQRAEHGAEEGQKACDRMLRYAEELQARGVLRAVCRFGRAPLVVVMQARTTGRLSTQRSDGDEIHVQVRACSPAPKGGAYAMAPASRK